MGPSFRPGARAAAACRSCVSRWPAAAAAALLLAAGCHALLDIDGVQFGDPPAEGAGGVGATTGGGGQGGTAGSGASGGLGGTGGGPLGGGGAGGAAPLGPFGTPAVVTALSDPDDDDDPTFTADLLELYFNTARGGGSSNFWRSVRAAPTDPWGAPVEVPELNSTYGDTNCVVAPDGLTIWFSSPRDGGGDQDIYVATRPSRASTWSTPAEVPELGSSAFDGVGAVSSDGLSIIIYSNRAGGQGGDDLYVATRAAISQPWGAPTPIAELNTPSGDEQPWLGPASLTLYFDSDRGGTDADIFVTHRATPTSAWSAPVPVVELNTSDHDTDAWLSPDMRYIMFTRGPLGTREIYEAFR